MIATIFPRALRAALPLAAFLLLALPTGAGAQVQNIFDFISSEGSSSPIFIQVAPDSTEDVTCAFASGSGFTATPGEDFDAGPFEGTRRERSAADPDHGIAARGRLSW